MMAPHKVTRQHDAVSATRWDMLIDLLKFDVAEEKTNNLIIFGLLCRRNTAKIKTGKIQSLNPLPSPTLHRLQWKTRPILNLEQWLNASLKN